MVFNDFCFVQKYNTGDQVVSGLASNSDNLGWYLAEVFHFDVKIVVDWNKNNQKKMPVLAHLTPPILR